MTAILLWKKINWAQVVRNSGNSWLLLAELDLNSGTKETELINDSQ